MKNDMSYPLSEIEAKPVGSLSSKIRGVQSKAELVQQKTAM